MSVSKMIKKYNQYSSINEKNNELKTNKKIFRSLSKVNKLLKTDYHFDLSNIIPIHQFYRILLDKYNLDNYQISLLIINQYIKIINGDKDDYEKIGREMRINKVDVFINVVNKSFNNINTLFNLVMKKYNILYINNDIFTKKYVIPLIYIVNRYIDNYKINIMDFSDIIILNEDIFKDIEKFTLKSLHSMPEKYKYFFDKLGI